MWAQLREALTITALILAMLLSGVTGARRRAGTLTLALISFAWLTVDAKWEGGVLIDFGQSHGLTSADLVGLVGLAVAGWQGWRHRKGGSTASQRAAGDRADEPVQLEDPRF